MSSWQLLVEEDSVERPVPVEEGVITIGRGDGCTVVQCAVERRGERIFLRDEGSHNGTWRNGARVEGEVELQEGDDIRIGRVHIRPARRREDDSAAAIPVGAGLGAGEGLRAVSLGKATGGEAATTAVPRDTRGERKLDEQLIRAFGAHKPVLEEDAEGKSEPLWVRVLAYRQLIGTCLGAVVVVFTLGLIGYGVTKPHFDRKRETADAERKRIEHENKLMKSAEDARRNVEGLLAGNKFDAADKAIDRAANEGVKAEVTDPLRDQIRNAADARLDDLYPAILKRREAGQYREAEDLYELHREPLGHASQRQHGRFADLADRLQYAESEDCFREARQLASQGDPEAAEARLAECRKINPQRPHQADEARAMIDKLLLPSLSDKLEKAGRERAWEAAAGSALKMLSLSGGHELIRKHHSQLVSRELAGMARLDETSEKCEFEWLNPQQGYELRREGTLMRGLAPGPIRFLVRKPGHVPMVVEFSAEPLEIKPLPLPGLQREAEKGPWAAYVARGRGLQELLLTHYQNLSPTPSWLAGVKKIIAESPLPAVKNGKNGKGMDKLVDAFLKQKDHPVKRLQSLDELGQAVRASPGTWTGILDRCGQPLGEALRRLETGCAECCGEGGIACTQCKGERKAQELVACRNCQKGWIKCLQCDGSGQPKCKSCGGTGSVKITHSTGGVLRSNPVPEQCRACHGRGKLGSCSNRACEKGRIRCRPCGQTGMVKTKIDCRVCRKTGRQPCTACAGSGARDKMELNARIKAEQAIRRLLHST
jgi:hypothetical protein